MYYIVYFLFVSSIFGSGAVTMESYNNKLLNKKLLLR